MEYENEQSIKLEIKLKRESDKQIFTIVTEHDEYESSICPLDEKYTNSFEERARRMDIEFYNKLGYQVLEIKKI